MTTQPSVAEPDFDARELRNALGRFPTGVAVVTTSHDTGPHIGVTVNSFAAVSLDPPLVLWSLRADSPSLRAFIDCGHFVVNVLAAAQASLCGHFARPAEDKFATIEHGFGSRGCPTLTGALAIFECDVYQTINAGDHVIFLGAIKAMRHRDAEPLVFSGGRLTTVSDRSPAIVGASLPERRDEKGNDLVAGTATTPAAAPQPLYCQTWRRHGPSV